MRTKVTVDAQTGQSVGLIVGGSGAYRGAKGHRHRTARGEPGHRDNHAALDGLTPVNGSAAHRLDGSAARGRRAATGVDRRSGGSGRHRRVMAIGKVLLLVAVTAIWPAAVW